MKMQETQWNGERITTPTECTKELSTSNITLNLCIEIFCSTTSTRFLTMPKAFLVKKKTDRLKKMPSNFVVTSPENGCVHDFQHSKSSIKDRTFQMPTEICWEKTVCSYPAEVTSIPLPNQTPNSTALETEEKQLDFGNLDENGNEVAPGRKVRGLYQCQGCSKSCSSLTSLLRHQQYHCHPHQKRPFHCKYCDKLYVSLGALKMHIRTHTLPCKCKICGKAFSRPWLLQGHIRTHTGEKPYKCSNCQRAFADRSNLRAHLQTHSDVKKYCCSLCSKSFSRMSLLLKHKDNGCPGSGS